VNNATGDIILFSFFTQSRFGVGVSAGHESGGAENHRQKQ
jgi:hypothetical protein